MSDNDNNFHKGLFYGMLLGVGLVWFLGTKEGKKLKEQILENGQDFIDKASIVVEEKLQDNTENRF